MEVCEMEENSFKERLQQLKNYRVYIETKTHHVGYLIHKGVLVDIGEDYIELDSGNKMEIIPISEIRVITIKE